MADSQFVAFLVPASLSVACHALALILPSNSGHLKNVIRYDEVNNGKIDDINEEKILYPLFRCLSARSVS
ncbi:hypothetical protein, partial [Halomonas sp. GFAJ-1]|uniref:hypothetical protein n=1 Tax=Halomonas sp. GFAJ-1 TaxID=1118153 RepID=UPI00023A4698